MLIIAIGSRGDVQPAAVLAGAATRAGTPSSVLAVEEYGPLVRSHGAGFIGIEGRIDDSLGLAKNRLTRPLAHLLVTQGWMLQRWMKRLAPAIADATLRALEDHDSVLTSSLTVSLGPAIEATGRRVGTLLFSGQLPTAHRESHYFGHFYSPWDWLNRPGIDLSWETIERLSRPVTAILGPSLAGQAGHRLSPRNALDLPAIIAASPILVPPAPDWPASARQSGTIVDDETAPLPDDLEEFLADGDAVYVGFGSMGHGLEARDLDLIREAAMRSGTRIVTPALGGWAPGRIDELTFATGPVPHSSLLPRMSGIVHHGGAGTTFAALRSGVPSVAAPFGVDQPYHAARIHSLGVGPASVRMSRLTARRLAGLLDDLTSGVYDDRAAEIGRQCRAEDGVGSTLDALEELGFLQGGTG
ncbi:nucleotide disphospho-sugar-binding domain-containing protein [Tessaracoccus flavescens]|uniref:Erythromycin biosynthesis protein CIII-like C-terminal domain-containing protein n=1 Tax=Tessaracoccus flavescens TaxID=399497 RepID=A0A1Q2D028_9ACTN|nr:glycosyltransferase [Tessaracoccus flavescens]AQP51728.1 hypothetical protein BW733_13725 [Tessaracoccus flavescens]